MYNYVYKGGVDMECDNFNTEFERQLYDKQFEMEMGITEFANYIGVHRTWLSNLRNNKQPKHKLSDKTMALIHNKLGMDINIMLDFNNKIKNGEI